MGLEHVQIKKPDGTYKVIVRDIPDAIENPEEARARLPALPRAKFRAALKAGGHLATIASALAAIPDATQKALAQEMLDSTSTFSRGDRLVERIRKVIGLTPEQFDALWSDAAGLELTI